MSRLDTKLEINPNIEIDIIVHYDHLPSEPEIGHIESLEILSVYETETGNDIEFDDIESQLLDEIWTKIKDDKEKLEYGNE